MTINANISFIAVTMLMSMALGGCVASASNDATVESSQRQQQGGAEATAEAVSQGLSPAAVYNGVCGSGYAVIDSLGVIGGTVYLTYNSGNGNNCVVTVRNTPGTAVPMCAWIETSSGGGFSEDCGNYTTYAGPVYLHAPHVCIDWGGSIGNSSSAQFDSHCG